MARLGASKVAAVLPSSAASARALRTSVSSPRRPSVPSARQSLAAVSSRTAGVSTSSSRVSRGLNLPPQRALFARPLFAEGAAVLIKGFSQADDLDPVGTSAGVRTSTREAEAVLKLGTQLPLLGVAAAN